MNKKQVMNIVKRACAFNAVSCRGLELSDLARRLMDLVKVPEYAIISEIPCNWDNCFVVLFEVPTNNYYYELSGGLSALDGSFYFNLAIVGKWTRKKDGVYYDFYQEAGKKDTVLPLDYFEKEKHVPHSKEGFKRLMLADYTLFFQPMPTWAKELFPVVTVSLLSDWGLHFTTDHTAKMLGIDSISTTCKGNNNCRQRIEAAFRLVVPDFDLDSATIDDIKEARRLLGEYIKNHPECREVSICGFCFSDRQQDIMTNMQPSLLRNHKILNENIIHSDFLPVINSLWFRIESFGDFASVNAVTNIMNIIKKNPLVFFGVWSKNPQYFHKYFNGDASLKPVNCNILLSGQFINRIPVIPSKYAYFIDKTFTVFTKVFAEKNSVCINCGARACLTCLKCYTKNDHKEIREMLK